MEGGRIILAGIDEAGYGPLLGPLCVGMSVFEVPCEAGSPPPCLWKLLSRAVCREAGRGGKPGARGRIPIADSKQLKLAGSVTTTHPLVHLERGVLCMARCAREAFAPTRDDDLLAAMGSGWPPHACYAGEAMALPRCHESVQLDIASNVLRMAMVGAGVEVRSLRCRVMGEEEFNRLADVPDEGGKGATTQHAVGEHLAALWDAHAEADESGRARVGVVCDRLGGRASYGEFLARAVEGADVEVVEESATRSRYVLSGRGRRMGVSFLVEGEQAHLPVALASMIAKYVREVCMARFNRGWNAIARDVIGAELKPTAGYSTDARRWLHDAREVLSAEDRRRLVRRC